MKFTILKEKQRKLRKNWSKEINDTLGVRVHRALSWLKASEDNTNLKVDNAIAFLSLWISFNALYGQKEVNKNCYTSERNEFNDFFSLVIPLDENKEISTLIHEKYSGAFRVFIDNKFVFQPFWDWKNKLITEEDYEEKFDKSNNKLRESLQNLISKNDTQEDCITFLGILFDRIYLLRNQIMHGCATFEGKTNAEQLKLAVDILKDILPILINILLDNPNTDFGKIDYLVIE